MSKFGFVLGKAHAYLGRFKRDAILRAGHNTNGRARTPEERMVEEKERNSVGGQTVLPPEPNPLFRSPHDRRGPKFGVPDDSNRKK